MYTRHRRAAVLTAALAAALAVTIAGCSTTASPAADSATGTGASDTTTASTSESTAADTSAADSAAAVTAPAESGAADASPSTITIVDHTGKEVVIPSHIERVAIDQVPLASTYLAYFDGAAPNLIGMSAATVDSLRGTIVADMAPQIFDVDTSYYDNGDLNVESLLAIHPDVVFYNAQNTKNGEMFAKAGIPAVGFSTEGDPTTLYADWLRLFEQVFQEPGKMDAKLAAGQQLIDGAKARVAKVADADRKSVLMEFAYAQGTMRVAGETPFFGSFWMQAANLANAAVGADGGLAPVSGEQILAWDPDLVLLSGAGSAGMTPEQLMAGTVDGLDLSALRSVKNGDVYSSQLGMWNWFTPNPDAPLIVEWLGKLAYPDLFADVDLAADTKAYYQQMYGFELTDQQVGAILADSGVTS